MYPALIEEEQEEDDDHADMPPRNAIASCFISSSRKAAQMEALPTAAELLADDVFTDFM